MLKRVFVTISSALLFVACEATFTSSNGRLQIIRYEANPNGEIQSESTGEYELLVADSKYCVRMLSPTTHIARGIFILSDYTNLFESEIVYPFDKAFANHEDRGKPGPWTDRAFATVSNNSMPNSYDGWGAAQGVALGHLLLRTPPKSTSLARELIPDAVIQRGVHSGGRTVHGLIELQKDNTIRAVKFFGILPGDSGVPLVESPQCWLLGEIEFFKTVNGHPLDFKFTTNFFLRQSSGDGKSYKRFPYSVCHYSGVMAVVANDALLSQNAYNPVSRVHVQDLRVRNAPAAKYILGKGTVVDFSIKKLSEPSAMLGERSMPLETTASPPRAFVIMGCVLSFGFAFYFAVKKEQPGN